MSTATIARPAWSGAAFNGPVRRPHQIRALAALTAKFATHRRAQIHWACGTGKTLVSRWLAEDLAIDTGLILVPSLGLIAQTLAEWQKASPWPFRAMVVCSDRSTGDAWRIDAEWWTQHGVEVTTDARAVTRFLVGHSDLPRIVFSTYHSAPVVAEAVQRSRTEFDLMYCDEAHRLAGRSDERFRIVLDDTEIPARRRLFATATPVYTSSRAGCDQLSMADPAVFGPVVDTIDFAEAIAQGLLVDYQVVVLDSTGDIDNLDAGTSVPAVLSAAAAGDITRVISFHSRVIRGRRFAESIDGMRLPDGRTVRANAIAGTDPTALRRAALDDLAAGHPGSLTLLANARCLTEGIDVPAVDGIVFADPKSSDTDIVQAIGRALRPSPGKTRGLIILPVVIAPGSDSEELFAGPFAAVWGVLRVLRSLDARMAAVLNEAKSWTNSHAGPAGARYRHPLLQFDVSNVDLSSLAARIVDDASMDDTFDDNVELLRSWIRANGHSSVPWSAMIDGRPLGRWAGTQRRAYAADALPADRVRRLESVPGWAWTLEGSWWAADIAAIAAVATENGGLDVNNPDVAAHRLTHRAGRLTISIGRWCARQRRDGRMGELSEWQIEECEKIPGWAWDGGVPERDMKMVDALAEWVDRYGHANVPHEAAWGKAPLGAFITAVRRRAVTDRLSAALAEDIAAVTPRAPADGALEWRPNETRWELHLLAVQQFIARTGGCDIPEHHVEEFNGYPYPIYEWATRQRYFHRHGRINPEHAAILEKIPAWKWERERAVRVVVGIGARQHGTRLGYAAGCLCDPCTSANTAYEAARQRSRAAGEATTDLVDSAAARGHLRILEAQVGKRARPAMQQVTGLNKKTVDGTINGTTARIHPEVDAAFRGLTVEALRAHIAAHPSPRDQIPQGPTVALIDDLVGRGFRRAWISRELGSGETALRVARSGSGLIRRETAEAIAALHAAVGTRTAPAPRYRAPMPSLAEIVAGETAPAASLGRAA